jgi:predicted Zn-dependent peptidase
VIYNYRGRYLREFKYFFHPKHIKTEKLLIFMDNFSKVVLSSGLTILFEKRNLPVVSVVVATRTGAAYENEKNKGLAHFFEHMLFKGSRTRGQKEISSSIEKIGGILNGFTAEQVTSFYCKVPSKHFNVSEVIMDMVSDPKFDPKELERERGVILQEINMVHDDPKHFLFDKMKEISYQKPFALPILGSKENILGFKRDSFVNWHNHYYNPNNLIISIVGKADFSEITRMSEAFFNSKSKSHMPQLDLKPKIGKFLERRKHIDQAHLGLLFKMPSMQDLRRYPAEVFSAILGEGMSSRLFQEVREKRGLAYTVRSMLEQEKDYGHCLVYAGVEKKNLKKAKEIILREIKGMKKISSKEIDEAKEQCIGRYQVDNEQCDSVAIKLILEEISKDANVMYRYPENIANVSLNDVREMAKIKGLSEGMIVPN